MHHYFINQLNIESCFVEDLTSIFIGDIIYYNYVLILLIYEFIFLILNLFDSEI